MGEEREGGEGGRERCGNEEGKEVKKELSELEGTEAHQQEVEGAKGKDVKLRKARRFRLMQGEKNKLTRRRHRRLKKTLRFFKHG